MSAPDPNPLQVGLATIEPTWRIAVRVWWSWQWRTFLVGFLLSLFMNFWIGILAGAVGLSGRGAMLVMQVNGFVVMALVGLYFFRDVLDRGFGRFRVCVVPEVQGPTSLRS